MTLPLVLFGIAALGGLLLATLRLKNRALPMPLALIHGAVAAAGLVALLLLVLANGGAHNAGVALVLFVVAALGGFFLFSFHLRNKPLPIPVMAVHALVAVAGFALLLLGVLQQG